MFDHNLLNSAFRHLDSSACLSAVEADGLSKAENAQAFLLALRQSGCLLVKQTDQKKEAKRDEFVTVCRELLSQCQEPSVVKEFESHVEDAHSAERGFRTMWSSLQSSAIWQLAPEIQAWGIIHRGVRELGHCRREVDDQIRKYDPKTQGPFDPKNVRMAETGVTPDHIDHGIVASVGTTLFLLAYGHGWIDKKTGVVVLPPEVEEREEDVFKSGTHMLLSLKWRHLERAWDRARFFGAKLRIQTREIVVTNESVKVEFLEGEIPSADEIFDHISENRLLDIFYQHQMSYFTKGLFAKVPVFKPGQKVPLPPKSYVSLDEKVAADVLQRTFCVPYDDETKLFEGLSLKVWLRGYSFYQTLARTTDDQPVSGCIKITEDELTNRLVEAGLSRDEATVFIELTTFQKYALDLFDAPILRVSDGTLRFFAPAHFTSVPSAILLSRISSLNRRLDDRGEAVDPIQFTDKGKSFEKNALNIFRSSGFEARSFSYSIEGVDYDCDIAVLHEGVLFVFECKNYSLPLGRISALHYFKHDLSGFAKQVTRICRQFEQHPEIVRKEFGDTAKWKTVVPCVLQALPWSMGKSDGVYFYDQSALSKFLTEGKFSIRSFGGGTVETPPLHSISFYDGDRPTSDELLKEMAAPLQLKLAEPGWKTESYPIEVGERFALALPEWRQEAISTRDQLRILGCPEEVILRIERELKTPVPSILSEVFKNLSKARFKKNADRNSPCRCGSKRKFKHCCWSK